MIGESSAGVVEVLASFRSPRQVHCKLNTVLCHMQQHHHFLDSSRPILCRIQTDRLSLANMSLPKVAGGDLPHGAAAEQHAASGEHLHFHATEDGDTLVRRIARLFNSVAHAQNETMHWQVLTRVRDGLANVQEFIGGADWMPYNKIRVTTVRQI